MNRAFSATNSASSTGSAERFSWINCATAVEINLGLRRAVADLAEDVEIDLNFGRQLERQRLLHAETRGSGCSRHKCPVGTRIHINTYSSRLRVFRGSRVQCSVHD
jgi:hypothetical protein